MYRSCPQDPGYFKLFKGLLLVEKNQEYLKQTINLKEIKLTCPIVLNAKSLKIQ